MFHNLVERFRNSRINGKQFTVPAHNHDSAPVIVNVYDMYWINEYTTNIGLGVYHSGVEVHGIEYCYGGHQFSMSGVFPMTPKNCEELGENYVLKSSIEVGKTDFSDDDVKQIIETLGEDFRGDQYHLLNKNCNHFAEALVHILCGQSIPKWVNRLASFSSRIPFIERAIPREWITPLALQDELDSMYDQDMVMSSSRSEYTTPFRQPSVVMNGCPKPTDTNGTTTHSNDCNPQASTSGRCRDSKP